MKYDVGDVLRENGTDIYIMIVNKYMRDDNQGMYRMVEFDLLDKQFNFSSAWVESNTVLVQKG